jgi:FlaA1/EpsC-like NDP-sugar epimerase
MKLKLATHPWLLSPWLKNLSLRKISSFSERSSTLKKLYILQAIDLLTCFVAIYIALGIRFEHLIPISELNRYSVAIAITVSLQAIAFHVGGLYHQILRYSHFAIIAPIARGVIYAEIAAKIILDLLPIEPLPRSVQIIRALLTLMLIANFRFTIGQILQDSDSTTKNTSPSDKKPDFIFPKQPIIIYGAGNAGFKLSQLLANDKTYKIIAFVDDATHLHGRQLNKFLIYFPEELPTLIATHQVKTILLAIPSSRVSDRKRILKSLSKLPVTVKTIPTIQDLLSGKSPITQLRDIDISDLLGREEVLPDPALLKSDITDKVVLVTGAGGSIGSELCRQIAQQRPRHLVLYEINEFALYSIDMELAEAHPNLNRTACLGSITDADRLRTTLTQHRVETIYHAAAYKHVPLVEANAAQGIINNAYGTMVTAQAAIAAKVQTFVLISTDKAVRPTNIMGTTKRVAELILQALAAQPKPTTRFVMVRFGNVLNSSGSVVPRFQKQIREGKSITLTHKDITRYFMSIPEAARLVIQAGALGKGGEVFLLDMGDPVRIYDLAVQMIELSGLTQEDIQILITGLRPGEKLYEELLIDGDKVLTTRHPKIYAANEMMLPWDQLKPKLDSLFDAAQQKDFTTIKLALKQLVPEYQPQLEKPLAASAVGASRNH